MSLPQGQIRASHRIRPTAVGIIVGLVLQMLALVHDLLLVSDRISGADAGLVRVADVRWPGP